MLAARSPLLDDLAERPELLPEIRDRTSHNARRSGVEQLARTLVDMGVLGASAVRGQLTREEWLARSRAGELDVPELWLDYAKRWFQTSTLSRSSRSQTYFALIKVGRWLNHEHPDHAEPRILDSRARRRVGRARRPDARRRVLARPEHRLHAPPIRRGAAAAHEGASDLGAATVLQRHPGVGVDRAAVRRRAARSGCPARSRR